ncbi:MAG: glycine C-acetyltransferase [Patescibacteria group bacterium]|mgnify:CR=1 FL=1
MYSEKLEQNITKELLALQDSGKFKVERELEGAQGPEVQINGKKVLMFASNNYLGLANNSEIIDSAKVALDDYGFGLSSVRFIAGTAKIHKELEQKLAEFLGVEDAILYSTNFMANLGFFASLTNEGLCEEVHTDIIYSDELNHASIIDAFKLCKKENLVKRIYPHNDLVALEKMLEEDVKNSPSGGYRFKIIVTDGVFSMEGYLANLPGILKLAEKYQALLFVDDAHAVGVLGKTGAGTPEYFGLHGKVDILSGTFGKALGGAVGGYIAGKKYIIEYLRQKSRTYTFSNSLPPMVVVAAIIALDLLKAQPDLLTKISENTNYFRTEVKKLGFKILEGNHPIVPVILGDAKLTQEVSQKLLARGIYVVGLWFPVVPEGEARLRFQISAAHTKEHLDTAISALREVAQEL